MLVLLSRDVVTDVTGVNYLLGYVFLRLINSVGVFSFAQPVLQFEC